VGFPFVCTSDKSDKYHFLGIASKWHLVDFCRVEKKLLSKLNIGEHGIIETVKGGFLAPKLADLGLFEGSDVAILYRAPLGDPLAVEVQGTVVSLRREEADWITVEA
jgi:Fe2+ transport system protein FeoA